MLETSDFNIQKTNIEPYVLTDTSGTTVYTAVSKSFNIKGSAIWKIKKEWQVGNIKYFGYPNGEQDFKFIWDNRETYTYK